MGKISEVLANSELKGSNGVQEKCGKVVNNLDDFILNFKSHKPQTDALRMIKKNLKKLLKTHQLRIVGCFSLLLSCK